MNSLSLKKLLLMEALELICTTTVLGVLYGIVLVLYCLCARLLYLQLREPDKRQQARFTLVYTSILLTLATSYLALNARMTQLGFVDYANATFPAALQSSYSFAVGLIDLIMEVMTMAIQIWRLWIVWNGSRYAKLIAIIPFFTLLPYIGLDVVINTVPSFNHVEQGQTGLPIGTIHDASIAAFVSQLVFTTTVTGLVIARLWLVRRRLVKTLGTSATSSPYMGIIAMLVESYALESVWSLCGAVSMATSSPILYLFAYSDSTIKVIAYLLIVYRVATGRAWTKNTEHKLTTLRRNHGVYTGGNNATASSLQDLQLKPMIMHSPPISRSESAVQPV